jgi:hypothetical protein
MGTGGFFSGLKRPGHEADHSPMPRSRKCGSIHPFPIRLHDVVLNSLGTGTTLLLPRHVHVHKWGLVFGEGRGSAFLCRRYVCCTVVTDKLLLGLASTVTLGSESRGTHDHILLSQIRDSLNLEDQVLIFRSGSDWVAQLYLQARVSIFVAFTTRRTTVEVFWPASMFLADGSNIKLRCMRNMYLSIWAIHSTSIYGPWTSALAMFNKIRHCCARGHAVA